MAIQSKNQYRSSERRNSNCTKFLLFQLTPVFGRNWWNGDARLIVLRERKQMEQKLLHFRFSEGRTMIIKHKIDNNVSVSLMNFKFFYDLWTPPIYSWLEFRYASWFLIFKLILLLCATKFGVQLTFNNNFFDYLGALKLLFKFAVHCLPINETKLQSPPIFQHPPQFLPRIVSNFIRNPMPNSLNLIFIQSQFTRYEKSAGYFLLQLRKNPRKSPSLY